MDSISALRHELYIIATVAAFFLTIIFSLIAYIIRKQDKAQDATNEKLSKVENENRSIVNNYTARFSSVNQRIDDTRLQITEHIRDMKEELLTAIHNLSLKQATDFITKDECKAIHKE